MSTLLTEEKTVPLRSERDLLYYFESFAKPRECMRVGLEAELFAVDGKSGKSLPYEGKSGIRALLLELAKRYGYTPAYEGDAVIALTGAKNMVTLEPGGQIELSAPPVENIFDVEKQLNNFVSELRSLKSEFPNVAWISCGMQPFSALDETAWVPKKRYEIMADYLSKKGKFALHMMRLTATDQINFDYLSESNAMTNLRTVFALTPVVAALFANSPFKEGEPSGLVSRRLSVWGDVDNERTGILREFLLPDRTFKDYLSYILDMPMIFIVRKGIWHPMKGMTFRNYLKRGTDFGHATLADFELHLSTAFPEVRLKQYLEIRGVDAQSIELIPSVAALWKGILYECSARDAALSIVSRFSAEELREGMREASKSGLKGKLGKNLMVDIAKELVDISCESLSRQKTSREERSECRFLNILREKVIKLKKSPGEQRLDMWEASGHQDIPSLLRAVQVA